LRVGSRNLHDQGRKESYSIEVHGQIPDIALLKERVVFNLLLAIRCKFMKIELLAPTIACPTGEWSNSG